MKKIKLYINLEKSVQPKQAEKPIRCEKYIVLEKKEQGGKQ